jgi:hypothetical protein
MDTTYTDTALVRLVVWSETVRAAELVEVIGVSPTDQADQMVTDSSGRTRPQSYASYWSALPGTDPLEAHFDDLVTRLTPATAGLQSLLQGGAASAELVATCGGPGPRVVLDFAPHHLAFFAALGLGFRLVVINTPEEKRRRAEFEKEMELYRIARNDTSA